MEKYGVDKKSEKVEMEKIAQEKKQEEEKKKKQTKQQAAPDLQALFDQVFKG